MTSQTIIPTKKASTMQPRMTPISGNGAQAVGRRSRRLAVPERYHLRRSEVDVHPTVRLRRRGERRHLDRHVGADQLLQLARTEQPTHRGGFAAFPVRLRAVDALRVDTVLRLNLDDEERRWPAPVLLLNLFYSGERADHVHAAERHFHV